MGGDREGFLEWFGTTYRDGEIALHRGDAGPRSGTWSHRDPVTLFGQMYNDVGWPAISEVFARLGEMFSDLVEYDVELVTADVSGDLAYTVAFEHASASMFGEPKTYTLRATQVYRYEDGAWHVVHRHADAVSGLD